MKAASMHIYSILMVHVTNRTRLDASMVVLPRVVSRPDPGVPGLPSGRVEGVTLTISHSACAGLCSAPLLPSHHSTTSLSILSHFHAKRIPSSDEDVPRWYPAPRVPTPSCRALQVCSGARRGADLAREKVHVQGRVVLKCARHALPWGARRRGPASTPLICAASDRRGMRQSGAS